jgi:hypothetical protein
MNGKKKGSQAALFSDQDVRRDYFKSSQWVEQHVKIKVHLTGFACAYEHDGITRTRAPGREPLKGRDQGSLHSQQKHAIANACEWIRLNARFKPRIMVATTPGFLSLANEADYISKLVHNLKNGYGMENYVWVRELTKKGFPHFHFVADMDEFDPVQLSLSWSRYFGSNAKNSIRLGTKPDVRGKRNYWIKNQRMCWYLTKYIGKSLGGFEKIKGVRRPRTFAISQEAAKLSQPVIYNSFLAQNFSGFRDRKFEISNEDLERLIDHPGGLPSLHLNPRTFSWRWTGHGQTFIGFLKDSHREVLKTDLIPTDYIQS